MLNNMTTNEVYAQFLPFAKAQARKSHAMLPVASQMDEEDLVQEFMIRVMDKIQEWDESKGMKFTTYGCQIIRWRAGEIKKSCIAAVERGEGYKPSLQTMNGISEDGGPADDWHPATYDDRSMELLEGLSDRDKDIVLRHTVNGESLRSIGEDYGVSGEAVRQWHNAALTSMRQGM